MLRDCGLPWPGIEGSVWWRMLAPAVQQGAVGVHDEDRRLPFLPALGCRKGSLGPPDPPTGPASRNGDPSTRGAGALPLSLGSSVRSCRRVRSLRPLDPPLQDTSPRSALGRAAGQPLRALGTRGQNLLDPPNLETAAAPAGHAAPLLPACRELALAALLGAVLPCLVASPSEGLTPGPQVTAVQVLPFQSWESRPGPELQLLLLNASGFPARRRAERTRPRAVSGVSAFRSRWTNAGREESVPRARRAQRMPCNCVKGAGGRTRTPVQETCDLPFISALRVYSGRSCVLMGDGNSQLQLRPVFPVPFRCAARRAPTPAPHAAAQYS